MSKYGRKSLEAAAVAAAMEDDDEEEANMVALDLGPAAAVAAANADLAEIVEGLDNYESEDKRRRRRNVKRWIFSFQKITFSNINLNND